MDNYSAVVAAPTFEELTTSSQLMLEISRALETSLSLPTSPYISRRLLGAPPARAEQALARHLEWAW